MRTIIINTLGSELRQNPLFYLPFDENQFHWIEEELNNIRECPNEIAIYHNNQDNNQDYHLVILVSLAKYNLAQYEIVCGEYKKLISAYINQYLLKPLANQFHKPPKGVSVVFVMPESSDGTGGIESGKEYDAIFNLAGNTETIESLVISTDDGSEKLIMDELFANELADFRESHKNEIDNTVSENPQEALNNLRGVLHQKVENLQECKYNPMGSRELKTLSVENIEFNFMTTNWDLFSTDLQMNLSNHIAKHLNDNEWHLILKSHSEAEIQDRLSRALLRVKHLRNMAPRTTYYSLKNHGPDFLDNELSGEIWKELINDNDLPWLKDVKDYYDNPVNDENANSLKTKLQRTWLSVAREKKLFDNSYAQLISQYDGEEARKEERKILDTCINVFSSWRKKRLSIEKTTPSKPDLGEMPKFDDTAQREELEKAQQRYAKASAECLESYEDLRGEAEKIKAKVNKAYRLWPEDEFNATSKFFIFSCVLAVLFILQMIVPYVGVTLGSGASLSRYFHFFISLGLFAVLYIVGVLSWMRTLCRELRGYTLEMKLLIDQSNERRRNSVINVVNIYGNILPQCTVKYEKLEELAGIHKANLLRKEHCNAHIALLEKSEEILTEMFTLLRISFNREVKTEQPKIGSINYEFPPSSSENISFYTLFSDKWGDKLC